MGGASLRGTVAPSLAGLLVSLGCPSWQTSSSSLCLPSPSKLLILVGQARPPSGTPSNLISYSPGASWCPGASAHTGALVWKASLLWFSKAFSHSSRLSAQIRVSHDSLGTALGCQQASHSLRHPPCTWSWSCAYLPPTTLQSGELPQAQSGSYLSLSSESPAHSRYP